MSPEQKTYLETLAASGVEVKSLTLSTVLNEAYQAKTEQMNREKAAKMQREYENFINDPANTEIKGQAIDTYAQFLRAYASCRMELGFIAKDLHFGHLAKTFGLIDPPKQLVQKRKDLKYWVKNGPKRPTKNDQVEIDAGETEAKSEEKQTNHMSISEKDELKEKQKQSSLRDFFLQKL